MNDLVWLLDFARKCLSVPITVWGFTISMWSIIVFSLFASVIFWFIGEIVSGHFIGGGE